MKHEDVKMDMMVRVVTHNNDNIFFNKKGPVISINNEAHSICINLGKDFQALDVTNGIRFFFASELESATKLTKDMNREELLFQIETWDHDKILGIVRDRDSILAERNELRDKLAKLLDSDKFRKCIQELKSFELDLIEILNA